jgi:predicted metal-dependent hydrolase
VIMSKHKLKYNDKEIEFHLIRKKVKNINLNVKPNLLIEVSASSKVPHKEIEIYVRSKADWILKNMRYFEKYQSLPKTPKEYVSGESFKYLGKQFRLKLSQSDTEGLKLLKGYFQLHVKDTDNLRRKSSIVKRWYKEKTIINFHRSLNRVYSLIEKYEIRKPQVDIRHMKARWGSCLKSKKTILLNSDLIEAPSFCIDYVVLHELIHFLHNNHTRKFYDMLFILMPDWEKRKKILDLEVIKDL